MTRAQLYQFMVTNDLAVVSSLSPEGYPQSAVVAFAVTEDLEIVFDTFRSSRKYGNLLANGHASVVIGWDGDETVQLEGRAYLLEGEELIQYRRTYAAKWPESQMRQGWSGLMHFVIRPEWVRYSDYGHRPPVVHEEVMDALMGL